MFLRHKKFFKALDLTKVSLGPVQLDVNPGQGRFLTDAETNSILVSVQSKARRESTKDWQAIDRAGIKEGVTKKISKSG